MTGAEHDLQAKPQISASLPRDFQPQPRPFFYSTPYLVLTIEFPVPQSCSRIALLITYNPKLGRLLPSCALVKTHGIGWVMGDHGSYEKAPSSPWARRR
jgi:hypothetical protein